MTIKEAVDTGKSKLNTPTPLLDAQVLLMYCAKKFNVNLNKVKLYTEPDLVLSEEIIQLYEKNIYRRSKNEPVQYITGVCEFMGMDFKVNPSTLIPRADTEILVENAINYIKLNNKKEILDMCTGSGAIAVSVCAFCENTFVTASDISEKAIETAKQNAKYNNVNNRMEFFTGDLFKPLDNKKFDVILSNPPYIKKDEILTLDSNVRDYEPIIALDGGSDGLYFYRVITEEATSHLNTDGRIYFEIGWDQSQDVEKILKDKGFSNIKTIKDLNGLDRVVYGDYRK